MNADTKQFFLTGEAGNLECALDLPKTEPVGIALLAHPHPLYGGTMNNKVVQMMARSFVGLGYASARMNFRGVGRSAGMHDGGNGDLLQWVYPRRGRRMDGDVLCGGRRGQRGDRLLHRQCNVR